MCGDRKRRVTKAELQTDIYYKFPRSLLGWVKYASLPGFFFKWVKMMHSSASQVLRIFCFRLRDLKKIILKVLRRSVTEKERNRVYSDPFKHRWHDNNFSVSGSSQKQSFQNCLHLVFLVSSSLHSGSIVSTSSAFMHPQGVLCICRARAGIQSGWLVQSKVWAKGHSAVAIPVQQRGTWLFELVNSLKVRPCFVLLCFHSTYHNAWCPVGSLKVIFAVAIWG